MTSFYNLKLVIRWFLMNFGYGEEDGLCPFHKKDDRGSEEWHLLNGIFKRVP